MTFNEFFLLSSIALILFLLAVIVLASYFWGHTLLDYGGV